jgi:2-amino-4-hydroxy-6-hydroxymethyldihydropteridine diphosphokinase
MITVYLGLGTNLGNRLANLKQATVGLGDQIIITAKSTVYETKAWGVVDQPDFLNMCLAGLTKQQPHELLQFIKQLETRLGRVPSERWGPRLIDIDILFFGQLMMDEPLLTIPHKGVAERASVLVPLAAIAPELRHPAIGKTIAELLRMVDRAGVRSYQTK